MEIKQKNSISGYLQCYLKVNLDKVLTLKTYKKRLSTPAITLCLGVLTCAMSGSLTAHAASLRGGFTPAVEVQSHYDVKHYDIDLSLIHI